MTYPLSFLIGVSFFCFPQNYALAREMMLSTQQVFSIKTTPIYNQNDVIKTINDFVEIPVLFPTLIKAEKNTVYFAHTNLDISAPQRYFITVGKDPLCSAHVCTLGSVMGELGGKLTSDYGVQKKGGETIRVKIEKTPVSLLNKVQGYYTPGYTGASYIEPKIQWFYRNVLYTIQWRDTDQKDLIQMANSAITTHSYQNK